MHFLFHLFLVVFVASDVKAADTPAETFCRAKSENTYYFANPDNCGEYFRCGPDEKLYTFTCAADLYFNEQTLACDLPLKADCARRGGYRISGTEEIRSYEKALYWGEPLPKERCTQVFCFLHLHPGGSEPFDPTELDPRLCTHLIIANFKLDALNGLVAAPSKGDVSKASDLEVAIKALSKTRVLYPEIKILASVGHLDSHETFSNFTDGSDERIQDIANKIDSFIRKHQLEGLEIHWTYPGQDKSNADNDRRKLARFAFSMKKAFTADESRTGKEKLILALGVPPDKDLIDRGYEPKTLSEYVDFIFLLAYDIYGEWIKSVSGVPMHMPLADWTVDSALNYWISLGFPKNNIVLGIRLGPLRFSYGNGSRVHDYSGTYSIVCDQKLKERAQDHVYGAGFTLPVADSTNPLSVTVVEDSRSFKDKVLFAASSGLGGILLADLNDDDYKGESCDKRKYPQAQAAVGACAIPQDVSDKFLPYERPTPNTRGRPVVLTSGQKHKEWHTGCETIFCFFSNMSESAVPSSKLHIQDIDPGFCTHLAYGYFHLLNATNDSSVIARPTNEYDLTIVKEVLNLKTRYPHLKLILGVLDRTDDERFFTQMTSSDSNLLTFALSSVVTLRQLGFDGMDLDWNFPNSERFVRMLEIIKGVFDEDAKRSGKAKLLLSSVVYARALESYGNYLPTIGSYLDTLRFQTSTLDFIIRGSVRKPVADESVQNVALSIDSVVAYLLQEQKVDPRNVILSLPFIARALVVRPMNSSKDNSEVRFEVYDKFTTKQILAKGKASYAEVCEVRAKDSVAEYAMPGESGQFVALKDKKVETVQMLTYEDETTLREKIRFIRKHGMAGGFVDNIAADDFTGGSCQRGTYPLLTAIGKECSNLNLEEQKILDAPHTYAGESLTAIPTMGCPQVVCYYDSQAEFREGTAKVLPSNIDPTQCTHVIFRHASISGFSIQAASAQDVRQNNGAYAQFADLRKKNPTVLLLLSVTTLIDSPESEFSTLVSSPSNIKSFSTDVVTFLQHHSFDGIELDFQVKAAAHVTPADRNGFTSVVQELREEFNNETRTLKPRKLIAIRVNGKFDVIDALYDISTLTDLVDLLLVDTYSYHSGSYQTHHYSPVFPMKSKPFHNLNIHATISHLITLGASANKLVVGIGFTAHTYTLSSPLFKQPGELTKGVGLKGNHTQQYGLLAYYEVCEVKSKGGKEYHINDQLVPYLVNGDQWIGFENPLSVRQKVRFSKLYKLGGVSVSSVDTDDVQGKQCGGEPFPLLSAVQNECSAVGDVATAISELKEKKHKQLDYVDNLLRVCYVSVASFSRILPAQFDVAYVPPGLCSHFILYSIHFSADGVLASLNTAIVNAIHTLKFLKHADAKLKIILGIQGQKPEDFYSVATSPEKSKVLFEGLKALLRSQNVDGLDIEWLGLREADGNVYSDFMKRLYTSMRSLDSWKNITLTLAVDKMPLKSVKYFELCKFFDFVNIFSFGFSTTWDKLGHNALSEDFKKSVNTFLFAGIPQEKAIAGISLYGKVFYLLNESQHEAGHPAMIGPPGVTTQIPGIWAYHEICYAINKDVDGGVLVSGYASGKPVRGESSLYFNRRIWVSYDSKNKVQEKAAWVQEERIGGYHLFTIDADNFMQSLCDFIEEEFPLSIGAHLSSRGK